MLALPEIKRYISSKIKYEDFVNYWKKIELKKKRRKEHLLQFQDCILVIIKVQQKVR